jgi:hypothetical protein
MENFQTPVSFEIAERCKKLPQNIQEKLLNFEIKQLQIIKKTRPKEIKTGDVFVLSPRKNIYFYGRVQKANINPIIEKSFVSGGSTIFIYKNKSKEISINNFKSSFDNLLIAPYIIGKNYWTQGYFYTIGNIPLTEEEKNVDYGFYKFTPFRIMQEQFLTEEGNILSTEPQIIGYYGITTITGIASEIEKELIIDPSLLEFEEGENSHPQTPKNPQ